MSAAEAARRLDERLVREAVVEGLRPDDAEHIARMRRRASIPALDTCRGATRHTTQRATHGPHPTCGLSMMTAHRCPRSPMMRCRPAGAVGLRRRPWRVAVRATIPPRV